MKQVMSSLVVQTNNYTCNEQSKGTAESWDKIARRVGTTLSLFGLGKGTHRENVVSFNAHTSPQRSERDSKMAASHSGLY